VTVRQLSFDLDGDARRVLVYIPMPAPAERVPLVVFLHAAGDTPDVAVHDTRFDRLAGKERFIAAFPTAAGRAWDVQVTPGLSDGPIDERWLAALIDHLLEVLPIDRGRVYVAGFSFGAVMADRLACRLADRLTAVAVVSGAKWIGAECSPSRPVSMLIIHGTADSTFGFDAGRQLADSWLAIDHCAPAASTAPIVDGAETEESGGCADATAVRFISVVDGWHTWFTAPDATRLAWEFFTEHRR
jgi:polyhydroxybutyrate depolymerase